MLTLLTIPVQKKLKQICDTRKLELISHTTTCLLKMVHVEMHHFDL